jgi:hypothetical protein
LVTCAGAAQAAAAASVSPIEAVFQKHIGRSLLAFEEHYNVSDGSRIYVCKSLS